MKKKLRYCVMPYVLPVTTAIFDLPPTPMSERVNTSSTLLLDPGNVQSKSKPYNSDHKVHIYSLVVILITGVTLTGVLLVTGADVYQNYILVISTYAKSLDAILENLY